MPLPSQYDLLVVTNFHLTFIHWNFGLIYYAANIAPSHQENEHTKSFLAVCNNMTKNKSLFSPDFAPSREMMANLANPIENAGLNHPKSHHK